MYNKKQAKLNLQETRNNFGKHLFELRQNNKVTLEDLSNETHLPLRHLENLEIGRLYHINIGELSAIARFFNKKLKVVFVD